MRGIGSFESAREKPGFNVADALHLDDAARFKLERAVEAGFKGCGHMNFSDHAMGFHSGGQIDSIAPDIIGKFPAPDNAGRHRAGLDADPNVQIGVMGLRNFFNLGQHVEGEMRHFPLVIVGRFRDACGDHIGIPDGFYFFEFVFESEVVEFGEYVVQQLDRLFGTETFA